MSVNLLCFAKSSDDWCGWCAQMWDVCLRIDCGQIICISGVFQFFGGQQRFNHVQPRCGIDGQVFVKCPIEPLPLQDWTEQTTLYIVNVNYQLGFFEPALDEWLSDVLWVQAAWKLLCVAPGTVGNDSFSPMALAFCPALHHLTFSRPIRCSPMAW